MPDLSPEAQRAAVWGGRRATVRPREAKWSSGVAAVFWVFITRSFFKDPFGHHYHNRAALYHKDIYIPGTYVYINNGRYGILHSLLYASSIALLKLLQLLSIQLYCSFY